MNGWSWRGGSGAFFIHYPSRRSLASLLGLLVGYSVGTVLLLHKLSLSSLADAAFRSACLRTDAAAAAAADQLIVCVSCRCAREEEEEEETDLFLLFLFFFFGSSLIGFF
jgi:hypothetical protein